MDSKPLMALALFAVGMLLPACWSSITPGDPSPDSGAVDTVLDARIPDAGSLGDGAVVEDFPTLEEFLAERRRLRCTHRVRCDIRDQRQAACHPDVGSHRSLDSHSWGLGEGWPLDSRVEAVRVGRMIFDEVAARSCLDAIAGAISSCDSQAIYQYYLVDEYPELDPTGIEVLCKAVFKGALGDGTQCLGTAACEDGLTCLPQLGVSSTTRYCRGPARSEAGGPCAIRSDCGTRAEDSDGYRCYRAVCHRLRSLGEPCDEESGPLSCADGLTCLAGVCAELIEEGEACDGWDCRAPFRCVDGTCGGGGADGDLCEFPDSGCEPEAGHRSCTDIHRPCAAGYECRRELESPTCAPTGGNDVGDLCFASDRLLGSSCRGELHCSVDVWGTSGSGTGVCEAGAATGEACDADISCARGNVCAAGRCTRSVVPGGACELHDECPLFHHCDRGLCRPLPGPGEACREDSGCIKGRCQGGMCCVLPDGAACETDFVGPGLGECNTYCTVFGACQEYPYCEGCAACWPDYDNCVPTCPAS